MAMEEISFIWSNVTDESPLKKAVVRIFYFCATCVGLGQAVFTLLRSAKFWWGRFQPPSWRLEAAESPMIKTGWQVTSKL